MENTRRDFIKKTMAASAAVSLGGILPGFSAGSYANIIGANERIQVGFMGVNSRGYALSDNYARQKSCQIRYICDVDSRAADKAIANVRKFGHTPQKETDFRKALDDKSLDAMVIATPDHWHAPAGILACKAGKHVYLEKPCSHNPHEGELMVAAAKKYNRVVQMGDQRRSWPNVIKAIEEVKGGTIGRAYFAKGWYTNNRDAIGIGKETAVPSWLDYDLWQGPAPRRPYKDNILHYNWHWFWHWGTGEALNNGTHMVDLIRWGLDADYPIRVTSAGGRYRYKDDWETPDTQSITVEFPNNTFLEWEGRSCNGRTIEGSSVGVIFYGEKGSLMIGGGNEYKIYDLKNKLIKEVKNDMAIDPRNRMNPSQALDALHIQNFFDGIKNGARLNSDVEGGHKSTLLVQLGNIAVRSGNTLNIDASNGHIKDDPKAQQLWQRQYEPGWEPKL
ncbi:Gfo/Idh/MocA family oxidoreductase [Compostibacter hankyongensis]|uniref:Gfo/Idh/MocA family oxidoreductase n=1 Tax=Compostibacter hankyongensis TaxID=1007089 RepID=A0ABP8G9M6_9BACT